MLASVQLPMTVKHPDAKSSGSVKRPMIDQLLLSCCICTRRSCTGNTC